MKSPELKRKISEKVFVFCKYAASWLSSNQTKWKSLLRMNRLLPSRHAWQLNINANTRASYLFLPVVKRRLYSPQCLPLISPASSRSWPAWPLVGGQVLPLQGLSVSSLTANVKVFPVKWIKFLIFRPSNYSRSELGRYLNLFVNLTTVSDADLAGVDHPVEFIINR